MERTPITGLLFAGKQNVVLPLLRGQCPPSAAQPLEAGDAQRSLQE